MEWNNIGTAEVRGECVIRGEVLNVWWTTLVVHILVLDYGELLGSSGLAECSQMWFVMWGMVPVSPWVWCLHLIAQLGSSMCMWHKARYMCFSL